LIFGSFLVGGSRLLDNSAVRKLDTAVVVVENVVAAVVGTAEVVSSPPCFAQSLIFSHWMTHSKLTSKKLLFRRENGFSCCFSAFFQLFMSVKVELGGNSTLAAVSQDLDFDLKST